jgi:hypothetical protein
LLSAGEIGATFTIKNDAERVLNELATQFNALDTTINNIKSSLSTLGEAGGGFAKLGVAATDASNVIKDAFDKNIGDAVTTAQTRLAELTKSIAATATEARSIVNDVPGTGGVRRAASAAEDLHLRNQGVALPGGNHATFGGDSFTPGAVIATGVYATDKLLNAGGDLETEKKLLRDRLGIRGSDANVDDATRAAIRYATGGPDGIIGTTPSENLKGINELLSVTPDLDSAIKMYPTMMRGAKDLEELSGGKTKAADSMKTLAKALENMGGGIDPKTHELSPERMQTAMNEAVKTIVAGGGFINDATLFGLAKQSGGMGRMTDPGHFFDETITSLIDVGGQRTGTAISALGRQFLGDKMTKQTATELEGLGILPHGSWKTGGGSGIIMNPGFDIKGSDEIKAGDLPGFFNDIIGPAVRAKVGDSNEALMEESYKIFGQQTGQRLGLMFLQNEAQRKRDVALKNGVDPASVYQGIGDKDYKANLDNLGTSFQGLMQVLGSNQIPGAITTLHAITSAVQSLTGGAADHPGAANNVVGGLLTPSLVTNTVQAFKDLYDHLPGSPNANYKPSILTPPGSAANPHGDAPPMIPASVVAPPRTYDPLSSIHATGSIAAPPVVNVQPALSVSTLPVTVNVDNGGLFGKVTSYVDAKITATLSGLMSGLRSGASNSASSFDGRSAPSVPGMGIGHQ